MLGSRRTKDFQAISGCMLLQNCGKLPGLECVSMGPDILDIHTPRERMSISSVQRMYAFVLKVLGEKE